LESSVRDFNLKLPDLQVCVNTSVVKAVVLGIAHISDRVLHCLGALLLELVFHDFTDDIECNRLTSVSINIKTD
jgi:hypothetical protein